MTPVTGFKLVTHTSAGPTAKGGVVAMMQGSCTPVPQSEELFVTAIVVASFPKPALSVYGYGADPPKLTTLPY
jgi:hypothetical protein